MHDDRTTAEPRRSFWYAGLIGLGVMAAVDEIIFHQVLQWHHFVDLTTPTIGILTDGLLHAAELIAIVAGFFFIADLARKQQLVLRWAWPGLLLGAGGFQLFDGLVNHKILRLHQIRYGVDLFVYDLTWNAAGLLLLLVGAWLYYRAQSAGAPPARS